MNAQQIQERAMRMLSIREHSYTELYRKLARFEETPGSLSEVLDHLQTQGLISEQRVLESVVHRRAHQLGATRLRQELLSKGVSSALVSKAVTDLNATEYDRAFAVWQKKFGEPAQDATTAAKQSRFLLARGFGGDVVRRVVGWSRS